MKSCQAIFWTTLFASVALPLAVAGENRSDKTARRSLSNLPISFEANRGQADSAIEYVARGGHYTLLLTSNEAVLSLKKSTVRMRLIGANPSPKIGAAELQPGKSNYFRGN